MKQLVLLASLFSMAGLALAQEQARVISSTPIVQQVAVPQQVCQDETVYTGPRTSGGGAVLGAIAGGAAGNTIGGGSGRAAATAIGVIGGALLGNQIEGQGRPAYQDVQRCSTETFYENRTVGYTVVYEYAGRQYTTRTERDPGGWIPISVQPVADRRHGRVYSTVPDSPSQPGRVVSRSYPEEPMPLESVVIQPPVTVIEYNRQREYYPPPPPPRPHYRHHREDWR